MRLNVASKANKRALLLPCSAVHWLSVSIAALCLREFSTAPRRRHVMGRGGGGGNPFYTLSLWCWEIYTPELKRGFYRANIFFFPSFQRHEYCLSCVSQNIAESHPCAFGNSDKQTLTGDESKMQFDQKDKPRK